MNILHLSFPCKSFLYNGVLVNLFLIMSMGLYGCAQVPVVGEVSHVTAAIGQTNHNPKMGRSEYSGSVDKSDTGQSILVGFDPGKKDKIIFEAGYSDLGKTTYDGTWLGTPDTGTIETTSWNLAVGYVLPLNTSWYLSGKVGLARWDNDENEDFGGIPYSTSISGTDTLLGFGAQFDINDQWSVRLDWERFTNVHETDDLDFISIGFMYRFGD